MALFTADYYVRPTNGDDGNAGTSWALAFKSLQKALDIAVAGKVVGCAAEAEEVLTAIIDDDTNSGGTSPNTIKIYGLNAAGERDGTRYVVNGNSAVVNCLKINGRTNKKYINVQFKNSTGDGVTFATTLSTSIVFENCIYNNNGGDGFDCNIANSYATFYRCQSYSNTLCGFNATASITPWLIGCSVFLNGSHGVSMANSNVINCLIYKNTGNGVVHNGNLNAVIGNTIDGNAIGIVFTTVAGGKVYFNRITNNTTGISTTGGGWFIHEDYNYFYGNGTKFAAGSGIVSGNNSVDMAADGYVNRAANNYGLINGTTPAEGRFLAYPLDATNTDYSSIGIEPNPDFPTAANTIVGDTEDGNPGTYHEATVAEVQSGVTFGPASAYVGEYSPVPDTPTGLASSAVLSTAFTLSWDGMPRATLYGVYKNGVLFETVTTTHSHITGLSAATVYSMTVIAINGSGSSAASTALPVTTANPTTEHVTDHGSQALASAVSFGGAVSLAPAQTGRLFAFRCYSRVLTLAEFEFFYLNIVENNGKSVLRPN